MNSKKSFKEKVTDFYKTHINKRKYRHFESVGDAYKYKPKRWIANLIFAVIIVTIFLYFAFDVNFFNGTGRTDWGRFGKIFEGFFVPNFEYMFGYGSYDFESSVVYQIIVTFSIAFCGTALGAILALPFGFLASRKMVGKWAIISELILIVIRTFPEILLGYVLIKGSGFGAFTAMMVLAIHSIGMIGKLYSEQLDLIDNGPIEALNACGGGFTARLKIGVAPQIAPNFISVILYRLDLNVRTATLLGLCAGDKGGIGYFISSYSENSHWPELGAIMWGVILMVLIVDIISSKIRKRLI